MYTRPSIMGYITIFISAECEDVFVIVSNCLLAAVDNTHRSINVDKEAIVSLIFYPKLSQVAIKNANALLMLRKDC